MKRRLLGLAFELAETFAVALVVVLAIQLFVAEPYRVKRPDMEGTLTPGQYLLVEKVSPLFDSYRQGDIVVFHAPSSWKPVTGSVAMRVIAVGGDTVDIHDGLVIVNGSILQEPYVKTGDTTMPTDPSHHTWTLEPDQLFVMGDHRAASVDSRSYGPIAKSDVIGRIFVRYWPVGDFEIMQPARPGAIPSEAP